MADILFAGIADDDTGASDLAGMFADQGVRTVLVLDPDSPSSLMSWTREARAVVLATATRAMTPDRAYLITRQAVELALSLKPQTVAIKYCSTFDSTPQGNIGPSLDAAMDAMRQAFAIVLPALPVNGRSTYLGHHFVHGQLLSDSSMRNHPLNPMTESNLVAWLGRQTSRRVGLTPHSVVASGSEPLRSYWDAQRSQGIGFSILDCISDGDAAILCDAAADLPLISGSSIYGTHLPAAWARRGWLATAPVPRLWPELNRATGKGNLIIAGSCSVATASQNAWLAREGATVIEADPIRLASDGGKWLASLIHAALSADETVLVKTPATPEEVARVQTWGRSQGMLPSEVGLRIAAGMAEGAAIICRNHPPRLIVGAGGETSSALCRALQIKALAVERNIQPGVPLCLALGDRCFPVVLKSGNFGSEDFYGKAINQAK